MKKLVEDDPSYNEYMTGEDKLKLEKKVNERYMAYLYLKMQTVPDMDQCWMACQAKDQWEMTNIHSPWLQLIIF